MFFAFGMERGAIQRYARDDDSHLLESFNTERVEVLFERFRSQVGRTLETRHLVFYAEKKKAGIKFRLYPLEAVKFF